MKDEKEIREKLKEVKHHYFVREYKDKMSCRPKSCIHNYRHEEDGAEVGLCMLGAENPEEWPGNVCDDIETAQKCPFFEQKHDPEDLEKEFFEKLENGKILAEEYKDIAALKWTLEGDSEVDLTESFSVSQRIKMFFVRIFVFLRSFFRTGD